MNWPAYDSDFITDILVAFKKRSKAIRHKVIEMSLQKEVENLGDYVFERLNFDFDLHKIMSSTRISVWEDRTVFINSRQKLSNGRIFNCKLEGRIADATPEQIINKIEETIDLSSRNYEGQLLCEKINKAWKNIIYFGPSKIATKE